MTRRVALIVALIALPFAAYTAGSSFAPSARAELLPGGKIQQAETEGFDACTALSESGMNTWREKSPFTYVGFYLGGVNNGECTNYGEAWVKERYKTRATYGYDFLPIWVGRQNPCTREGAFYTFSKTVATAQRQATEEAKAAIGRAEKVGFNPGAVIWYDMEQWEGAECLPAFKGFMNYWTKEIHAANFKSGLYSSPCSDVENIVNSSYPPDDVWLAEYPTGAKETPNLRSVYNVNCVGQNAWPVHRFHQWNGSNELEPERSYEEWGGIGAVVDEDCANGPDDGVNPDGEAARCLAK